MEAFPPFIQRRRRLERERATSVDKGHGRIERRTLTSTTVLNGYLDWPGVQQVCRIDRERRLKGRCERETAYYITSLRRHQAGPEDLLRLARDHWGAIENGLHYVRDEVLREDRSTIRTGDAPQNLAALRNAALNWLRQSGYDKLSRTLRRFARNPLRLFTMLGYPN
jgi:predicted transposase YbfD/YdcC